MTQWQRVYIDVDCIIQSDGVMRPRIIKWPDGRHFIIDKVICRRQAAAAKAGGQGDRYTIAVCGQERYLFLSVLPIFLVIQLGNGMLRSRCLFNNSFDPPGESDYTKGVQMFAE